MCEVEYLFQVECLVASAASIQILLANLRALFCFQNANFDQNDLYICSFHTGRRAR